MRTIDIHAHLVPQCLWRAFDAGETWHGIHHEPGAGQGFAVLADKRVELGHPWFPPSQLMGRIEATQFSGIDYLSSEEAHRRLRVASPSH